MQYIHSSLVPRYALDGPRLLINGIELAFS